MSIAFQNPSSDPVLCSPDSYCPAGSVSPSTCDSTWFVIDKNEHTCTPSPELIGVIIGGSLGNYIIVRTEIQ